MATTTSRSMRRGLKPAEPMPRVPALEQLYTEYGDLLRAGQVAMISGQRGGQKSGFAMWLVSQWNLPTLYVNGDMSAYVANSRHLSIFSGRTKDEVEEMLVDDRRDQLLQSVDQSQIRFMHDARPPLEDIEAEFDAWCEMYDEWPRICVTDNLLDLEPIAADEHVNLTELILQLKELARETGTLFLLLHHNKDTATPGLPSDISGLRGRVSQTAEVILSVALENKDAEEMPFRIAVVKQRSGRMFPKADRYVELVAVPDRTLFKARTFEQTVAQSPPNPYQNTWGT